MSRVATNISAPWSQQSLADVAESIFSGVASRRRAISDAANSVPVINVADLDDGGIAPLGEFVGPPIPLDARAEKCRVSVDDVLITSRGTRLKIARVTQTVAGAVLTSNLIAIRLGPDLLAPVLLAYLQSRRGRAAVMRRSRSSTINLALSARSIGRLLVPVPPMEVQQQITDLMREAGKNYTAALRAAEQRRGVAQAVANNLLMGIPGSEAPGRDINAKGDAPCTR
jgi:restriction endonuclease S subunit